MRRFRPLLAALALLGGCQGGTGGAASDEPPADAAPRAADAAEDSGRSDAGPLDAAAGAASDAAPDAAPGAPLDAAPPDATPPDAMHHVPPCPVGDGPYCGQSVGLEADVLYDCAAGVYTVAERCERGCDRRQPADPDRCIPAPPTCPEGDGFYCGEALGQEAGVLYRCGPDGVIEAERCGDGCEVHDGPDDACAMPPMCPSGNGLYCGETVDLEAGVLYRCTDGAYEVSERCELGCEMHPPGENDACVPPPPPEACPDGEGQYCGEDVGRDHAVLYRCDAGGFMPVEACTYGCQSRMPGVDAACAPPPQAGECPSGNGLYCGGEGRDPGTLYTCQDGNWSFYAACTAGCERRPPGENDRCAAGECPGGNGLYCGGPAGLDEDVVYRCANGAWRVEEACEGACVVAPAGQNDHCPDPG